MTNTKYNNSRGTIFVKLLITSSVFLLIIGVFTLAGGYYYYSSDLPDLKDITNYNPNLVNEIYSSDGKLIARFGLQKRMLVNLDEIPEHVKEAFIAVEDKRFFEHSGIDFIGILRALVENIKSGEVVAGGSTITQQVTKNLILTPERTLTRKIKEAILAYRIEKNLTKQEILYLYLNHIYLADGTYGVEAASWNYFDKPADEINIAEAALLAGIPKLPEYYSPRKNLERSMKRQKIILRLMKENELITEDEYEKALSYKIRISPNNNTYYQVAPYFVEFVRQYLQSKVGDEDYSRGGYKVITTLDIDLSLAAHWAVRQGIYEYESRRGRDFIIKNISREDALIQHLASQKSVEKGKYYNAVIMSTKNIRDEIYQAEVRVGKLRGSFKYGVSSPLGSPVKGMDFELSEKYAPLNGYKDIHIVPGQLTKGDVVKVRILSKYEEHITLKPVFIPSVQASLLSVDQDGNIVSLVGGFDFNESQFNRSVQAMRQPGSAFKPLVYAAALDKGYTETSILFDIPVIIKDWEPRNYDGEYDGAMLLREAIARSRNLATIRMTMDIGPDYVASYASKFGFKSKLNPYPSIALGGSDVTLLEMVKAYNVFASNGKWVEPRFIIRIYDRNGVFIEDNTDEEFILNEKLLKQERKVRRKQVIEMIAKKKGRTQTPASGEDVLVEKDYADTDEIYDDVNFLMAEEFIYLLDQHSIKFNPHIQPKQIISAETSYLVTDLLQAVITEGTARRAAGLNRLAPVAGKTGTTNDYTDAWFVGYSPKITTGVWVGKDDSTSLGNNESGARAALPIWIDYMEDALSDKNYMGGSFEIPSGVKIVETPYGNIPYRKDALISGVLKDMESNKRTKNPKKSIDKVLEDLKSKKTRENQKRFEDEAEIDFLLRR